MSDVYGKAEGHSKGFLWGPAGWTEIELGTSALRTFASLAPLQQLPSGPDVVEGDRATCRKMRGQDGRTIG